MGLFRRQPKTLHGVPTKDVARESTKDLRGIKAFIEPLLPPGEVVRYFVKCPANEIHAGLRYLVVTNRAFVECWLHDSGETFRYPFSEFHSMRVAAGYVRLAFNDPKRGVVWRDFFFDGGAPEFLAFYGKLAVAYEKATGRSLKEQVEAGRASVPEIPLDPSD